MSQVDGPSSTHDDHPAAFAARWVAIVWGIGGLLALMVAAMWRLSVVAIEALRMPLGSVHWVTLVSATAFMAYAEGYRGFQVKFSPRFAARARYLLETNTASHLLLAPLFCMSYFAAPRRRIIATVLLTLMIVVFVLSFRFLPQPWRGLLDFSVVVGLSWGTISVVFSSYAAFRSGPTGVDPEVVASNERSS